MKATVTVNQEELELKAIDSMIAYEKSFITYSEMEKAISDASLRQQGRTPGNRSERVDYKNDPRPRRQPTERP